MPHFANGKVCYLELPAIDVDASARFYEAVFGWQIRRRDDGSVAFDDGVDEVSGSFRTDRPPASSPGIMVHIMVDYAEATLARVVANGGEIVAGIPADPPEITAHFRDVAGNVLSIFQERALQQG
jgi:predicted enzyme related to lactoylglutathione lyase